MAPVSSILDTDLYKLTIQQCLRRVYPDDPQVQYRFTNRGGTKFTRAAFSAVQAGVAHLSTLSLTADERKYLESKCSFFTPSYLDYLTTFRFKPEEQVKLEFEVESTDADGVEWGRLGVEIKGGWAATILYEIPVMAIISEAYFTTVDTKWDYTGQHEQAKGKGKELFLAGCIVSEFGTRRRRTFEAQDIIMRGLIEANDEYSKGDGRGRLAGTSNVYFAYKYNLLPIGTIAHELIMGVAAIEGYAGSNGRVLDLWEATYPDGSLSIALTDTFSTKPFFDDFVSNPERANRWRGLRQDSGSPFKFIDVAKEAFTRVGADPKKKLIVFSDGLDVPMALKLKKASDEAGIGCSFGIGTTFTNDFRAVESPAKQDVPGSGAPPTEGAPSKALNMVIKLYKINGEYAVKISDELTKNTGNEEAVKLVKQRFGLE